MVCSVSPDGVRFAIHNGLPALSASNAYTMLFSVAAKTTIWMREPIVTPGSYRGCELVWPAVLSVKRSLKLVFTFATVSCVSFAFQPVCALLYICVVTDVGTAVGAGAA